MGNSILITEHIRQLLREMSDNLHPSVIRKKRTIEIYYKNEKVATLELED